MTSSVVAVKGPSGSSGTISRPRQTLRWLKALLLVDVLLQRVAVPVGTGVSIMLPVTLLVAGALVLDKSLLIDVRRTRQYLIGMGTVTVAALTAYTSGAVDASFTSWLLLVSTYLPFCLVLRAASPAMYEDVLDFFIRVVGIVAILAVVQYAVQLVGWQYEDLLGQVVPPKWLLAGFNTSYPVRYGSPIFKSNAFVCLEPSFCSQLIGLALVALLQRRGDWRWLVLLVPALLTTVSGTGLLILAAGLAGLAVDRGIRWAAQLLLVTLLAVLALSLSPAFSLYSSRATEAKSSDTSGSLRFVQPYTNMWTEMADTRVLLLGQGPGYGDRQSRLYIANTGLPLQFGTLPKLVVEYGVVAAVAFLLLVVPAFTAGPGGTGLKAAVLIFYFVLGGNLLAPGAVYLALLLTGWFSSATDPVKTRSREARVQDPLAAVEFSAQPPATFGDAR
jgi:hypothetical protein